MTDHVARDAITSKNLFLEFLKSFTIFYSHWEQFTHPMYGNCFTFNSGLNVSREVEKKTSFSKIE